MNEQEARELIDSLTPEEKYQMLFFLKCLKEQRGKTREQLADEIVMLYDRLPQKDRNFLCHYADWCSQHH